MIDYLKKFIRMAMLLACLVSSVYPAYGAEPVRIGVLAFRPKPQTLSQWQPLASALKHAMPERDFLISALTYPEMNQAVEERHVDFVLTNPSHFVQLKMRGRLESLRK
jgi:ABC-type phosphate/phosphonate transport system substrate-binding protein